MIKFPSFFLSLVGCLLVQRVVGEEPVLISQDGTDLREFADSLTNQIYTNDNDCSSTWGVSMMLDLLRPGSGAADETLLQLCDVVGLCGPDDVLLWNTTITRLTSRYDGSCSRFFEDECVQEQPTVLVANSVWIDTGASLTPAYETIVGGYLEQTDFESPAAGGVVNEWVNASTLGLIDSILNEGPIDYSLLAINSIYFKAAWQDPFSELKTTTDLFYANSTAQGEDAHFMHLVDFFPYSDTALEGYQVLQLPYANSDLSMILALPLFEDDSTIMNASSESIVAVLPELERTRMAIGLPKFTFESEYEDSLKEGLMTIGLTAPFIQGFCGLFTGVCRRLDLVKQKTYIEVNEEGTIAAAVTVGGIERGLPTGTPVLFLADRPFRFFIYDSTEDLVLFEGRVGAPEIPDESTAGLQASHTDADFWSSQFAVEPVEPEISASPPAFPKEPEPTTAPSKGSSSTPAPSKETTTSPTAPSMTTTRSSTTESPTASSGVAKWRKRLVWTAVAGLVTAILTMLGF